MTAKRIAEIRKDALNYGGPKRLLDYIEELCESIKPTQKRVCANCKFCKPITTTTLSYCGNELLGDMIDKESGIGCIYDIGEFGCNLFELAGHQKG